MPKSVGTAVPTSGGSTPLDTRDCRRAAKRVFYRVNEMKNRWKIAKQKLSRSFKWTRRLRVVPEESETEATDRRRKFLWEQLLDLEHHTEELKQSILGCVELDESDFNVKLRRKLIKARDFRYKRDLLNAELHRICGSSGQADMPEQAPPLAEEAPHRVKEAALEILSTASFNSRFEKTAFQRAIDDLMGPRTDLRRVAMRRICQMGMPACVPLLEAAMSFEDDLLFSEALKALAELDAPGYHNRLERGLLSPSPRIRLMALRWLYNKTGKDAEWAYLQGLADSLPEIRRASVNFLGLIGAGHCAVILTTLLRDENPQVRATTAKVLGTLSSIQTVGALMRALGDGEILVREEARVALGGFMAFPLDIDVNQSHESMSAFAEELIKWWAKARPEGPPWHVPISIVENSEIGIQNDFEVIRLYREPDDSSKSRKDQNIKQGTMR